MLLEDSSISLGKVTVEQLRLYVDRINNFLSSHEDPTAVKFKKRLKQESLEE
jgi:hypothetical protein